MSACPSVLFNIDSVVKASWRKPQAGWTQEEKNTAEALSNKDILKRLLPKVVDFHLEGVDPAVRARVVTGLHRALSFSIGVAHGKTELLVQIIPRIGAGAGGLGGSDEERAAVLAGIKTAADGLAIEHGQEVNVLLSCLYPLELCMELLAGRLAHQLIETETYSDDAAMTRLLRSLSDISNIKAKYTPWFTLDPKAAKFDEVMRQRGYDLKGDLGHDPYEEMQFWRTNGAEALFDRWAASVAGEGEACVMWTTHAFLAQAASDSGLFVVERAEAKHAGLLTNVVLRPHNYSEAVCALLAALWKVVHNMPQLLAAFHAANERPHPAGTLAMANCLELRNAMDGAVYAGQEELSTIETCATALLSKLDRQVQHTQKDVAELQQSTGRLGTRCDGLEGQVKDLTQLLEQEQKARRKLAALVQQLGSAMEAAAKDAGARPVFLKPVKKVRSAEPSLENFQVFTNPMNDIADQLAATRLDDAPAAAGPAAASAAAQRPAPQQPAARGASSRPSHLAGSAAAPQLVSRQPAAHGGPTSYTAQHLASQLAARSGSSRTAHPPVHAGRSSAAGVSAAHPAPSPAPAVLSGAGAPPASAAAAPEQPSGQPAVPRGSAPRAPGLRSSAGAAPSVAGPSGTSNQARSNGPSGTGNQARSNGPSGTGNQARSNGPNGVGRQPASASVRPGARASSLPLPPAVPRPQQGGETSRHMGGTSAQAAAGNRGGPAGTDDAARRRLAGRGGRQ